MSDSVFLWTRGGSTNKVAKAVEVHSCFLWRLEPEVHRASQFVWSEHIACN